MHILGGMYKTQRICMYCGCNIFMLRKPHYDKNILYALCRLVPRHCLGSSIVHMFNLEG